MHTTSSNKVQSSNRKGIATLELALVVPLLVVLVMGAIGMSRAMHVKQVLSDSCRSAGRLAIQPGKTVAQVDGVARSIMTYNKIDSSKATVTVSVNGVKTTDLASAQVGDDVSVAVALPASSAGFVTPMFLPANRWLGETIVMMRQR